MNEGGQEDGHYHFGHSCIRAPDARRAGMANVDVSIESC